MDILVPLTILVLQGAPQIPPCPSLVGRYRVVPQTGLVEAPRAKQGLLEGVVSATYDVEGRVLVVRPTQAGRIFCSGFELTDLNSF